MVIADLNLKFYLWLFYGGGSWIRTNVEINSADLQSAAIDHSAIPPNIILAYPALIHFVNYLRCKLFKTYFQLFN